MIDRFRLTGIAPILAVSGLVLLPVGSVAQPSAFRSCAVSDARCMDELVGASCLQRLPDERDPCLEILAELERRLPSAEPAILAGAAFAHSMLAEFPAAAADAAAHRAAVARLYRQVIAIDPNHVDAHLGLARVAADPEEELRWLRLAVAASDSDTLVSRLLASALSRQGTYENRLEAAEVMLAAYEQYPVGPHKWYLAENVLSRYRALGLPAEATKFQAEVRRVYDLEQRLDNLRNAASAPFSAIETLGSLCSQEVFRLLGASGCRSGAEDLLAEAGRVDDLELARLLVRGTLREIMQLPHATDDASWAPDLVPRLERLLAAGVVSWELYSALGRCQLELDQPTAALAAFEQALVLAAGTDATAAERDFIDDNIRRIRGSALPASFHETCPTRVIVVH
jgi:tetratricopeptide (TPR) repeat protein